MTNTIDIMKQHRKTRYFSAVSVQITKGMKIVGKLSPATYKMLDELLFDNQIITHLTC